MKKIVFLIGGIVFIISSTVIYLLMPKPQQYISQKPVIINVEITGEVLLPGKYQVLESKTLQDLINYASGVTRDADVSKINLNEVLVNNYQYHIPSYYDGTQNVFQVNLNEVDFKVLITIPGITENRAIAILSYRQEHTKFNSIEELLNVKGIGEATFNKIKDYFYIR